MKLVQRAVMRRLMEGNMNTEIKETTRETFKNVSQCDARCLRIIMAARKGDMDEAARLTDELQEVCRTCAKANEILGDIMDMMGADPKAVIEAYNYAIEKTVQPLSRLLLKRGIQHAGRGNTKICRRHGSCGTPRRAKGYLHHSRNDSGHLE